MEAAQTGAGRNDSFAVNIRLPFEQQPNPVIAGDPKLINFRYFFTRKVTFVKESHAIALFPGGFGTQDEGFEALTLIQTGKSELLPVVCLDAPGGCYWREWERYIGAQLYAGGLISEEDLSLFYVTDDIEVAVSEILRFYRNYHSSRYVGDRLVIRLRHAPCDAQLASINDEFSGLLEKGEIDASAPLPQEADEVPDLPRLVLRVNRRSVGRLRQLIDRLNDLVEDEPAYFDATRHEIVEASLDPEAERARDAL